MRLNEKFLPAFLVVIEELSEKDYLAEAFGQGNGCDGYPAGHNDELIKRTLIKHTGSLHWPLVFGGSMLEDEQVCDLVEFFYQYVSAPSEVWFHDFCRDVHPHTFDKRLGHYNYTVEVNLLFARFAPHLRIQSGRVTASGSTVLLRSTNTSLPYRNDTHLQSLTEGAIVDFKENDVRRKLQAVQALAQALERVKTTLVPGRGKKAQSVNALLQVMGSSEQLQIQLNAILKEMTDLSNGLTVRHHEVGAIELDNDVVLLEFLFYSYYNLIRLALLKIDTLPE